MRYEAKGRSDTKPKGRVIRSQKIGVSWVLFQRAGYFVIEYSLCFEQLLFSRLTHRRYYARDLKTEERFCSWEWVLCVIPIGGMSSLFYMMMIHPTSPFDFIWFLMFFGTYPFSPTHVPASFVIHGRRCSPGGPIGSLLLFRGVILARSDRCKHIRYWSYYCGCAIPAEILPSWKAGLLWVGSVQNSSQGINHKRPWIPGLSRVFASIGIHE